MKYITSVEDIRGVKHIVEAGGKNIEVIELKSLESYGNKKGETVFETHDVRVARDLHVTNNTGGSNFMHLAKIVLAIELVRFVISHLGQNGEDYENQT